jgi:probable addiction module antidote protein
MQPIKISELPHFDVADYLTDEQSIEAYLAEAAKENDATLWASALNDAARARKRWGLVDDVTG